MEVDAVNDEWAYGPGGKPPPEEDAAHERVTKDATHEWVASLGYGPTQGAVGKSGKGKDDKGKGKGKGGGWKGGGDKGRGLAPERGKGQWGPVLIVGSLGSITGCAQSALAQRQRHSTRRSTCILRRRAIMSWNARMLLTITSLTTKARCSTMRMASSRRMYPTAITVSAISLSASPVRLPRCFSTPCRNVAYCSMHAFRSAMI